MEDRDYEMLEAMETQSFHEQEDREKYSDELKAIAKEMRDNLEIYPNHVKEIADKLENLAEKIYP